MILYRLFLVSGRNSRFHFGVFQTRLWRTEVAIWLKTVNLAHGDVRLPEQSWNVYRGRCYMWITADLPRDR